MKQPLHHPFKVMVVIIGFFFIFFLGMESLALARVGSGRSSGSRGYSSGGSYQRSAPSRQQAMPQRPPVQSPAPQSSLGKTFLSGLGGGLVGGMLGSMLFGGRSHAGGGGFGGGGGGFGFGDFVLVLIVCGIAYFAYRRYKARKQTMAMSGEGGAAYAAMPFGGNSYEPAPEPYYAPQPSQEDPVSAGLRYISSSDPSFDEYRFKETVEDSFFKIQSAWTKRDLTGVKYLFTPQMLNTFQEDVDKFLANKQINRLENIAVRQVEIVGAVQEQGVEYITVKFLASLLDYVVDETTNQMISGNSTDPVKFLEYWTFTRRTGERSWVLSGITQEGDY
jgi:predicted lipid-binding transport protein (Tim44 family)